MRQWLSRLSCILPLLRRPAIVVVSVPLGATLGVRETHHCDVPGERYVVCERQSEFQFRKLEGVSAGNYAWETTTWKQQPGFIRVGVCPVDLRVQRSLSLSHPISVVPVGLGVIPSDSRSRHPNARPQPATHTTFSLPSFAPSHRSASTDVDCAVLLSFRIASVKAHITSTKLTSRNLAKPHTPRPSDP